MSRNTGKGSTLTPEEPQTENLQHGRHQEACQKRKEQPEAQHVENGDEDRNEKLELQQTEKLRKTGRDSRSRSRQKTWRKTGKTSRSHSMRNNAEKDHNE